MSALFKKVLTAHLLLIHLARLLCQTTQASVLLQIPCKKMSFLVKNSVVTHYGHFFSDEEFSYFEN